MTKVLAATAAETQFTPCRERRKRARSKAAQRGGTQPHKSGARAERSTPKNEASWLMMMYRPAPAVKPVRTGSLTKRVSVPRRASPAPTCMSPIKSVSRTMASMALPCAAKSAALPAIMTTMALVGPLMRNSELPKAAPMMDAATAVASPAAGGKPAMSA